MGEYELKKKERAYLSSIDYRDAKVGKKKTFYPDQHVFFKRYYIEDYHQSYNYHLDQILGGQIDVPEGYQVLSLQPIVGTTNHFVETYGVDVWYINNKRVEVEPVNNEYLGRYDYSEPGTVVETMIEEMGPELKLKP